MTSQAVTIPTTSGSDIVTGTSASTTAIQLPQADLQSVAQMVAGLMDTTTPHNNPLSVETSSITAVTRLH